MTEIEIENGIEMVTAMVTRRTDMSYFVMPVLCCRTSLQCAFYAHGLTLVEIYSSSSVAPGGAV